MYERLHNIINYDRLRRLIRTYANVSYLSHNYSRVTSHGPRRPRQTRSNQIHTHIVYGYS